MCSVDQSAITGESLAVDKFIGDIAYYTCGVKRGKLYAMVTCQAQQSFVGRTASLVMCESLLRWANCGLIRISWAGKPRTTKGISRSSWEELVRRCWFLSLRSSSWSGSAASSGAHPRVLQAARCADCGTHYRGIGIATPAENSLLVYALIFFVGRSPIWL